MDAELLKQVVPYFNDICSHLSVGTAWHTRASNECKKLFICNGWSTWHSREASDDASLLLCFTEAICSKLKITPQVDAASVAKAYTYAIPDFEAFKKHHVDWMEREGRFILTLNALRPLAVDLDMELYTKICCVLEEVQNEKLCIESVYESCNTTGWALHDVKVTSKWLQDYFSRKYNGGKIAFNIG